MFIADVSVRSFLQFLDNPPGELVFMSLVKSVLHVKEPCHKINFIKIQTAETATKFVLSVAFDIIFGGQSSIDNLAIFTK